METLISVNKRGVLTLPKEVRRRIGMTEGRPMSVRVTEEGVLLVPVVAFPVEVYTPERLAEFAEEEAKLVRSDLEGRCSSRPVSA
jgi:AbrB family looped-hinge helix DNA binding protein